MLIWVCFVTGIVTPLLASVCVRLGFWVVGALVVGVGLGVVGVVVGGNGGYAENRKTEL